MTVNNITLATAALGEIFENSRKNYVEADKKNSYNFNEKSSKSTRGGSKNGTATAPENHKPAFSTIKDVLDFIILVKQYILENFHVKFKNNSIDIWMSTKKLNPSAPLEPRRVGIFFIKIVYHFSKNNQNKFIF